jgi:MFS transporter, AAHS family, 3-hydroxyphenylpropionic acid transporter
MNQDRPSPLTLWFCIFAALCEGFDIQAAGVAAAGLSRELHPSPAALGYFFSASGAGLLAGALVGGRVADRIGRRAVLIASIATFGLFSLLTPLAWNMEGLTCARFLTGLGLGGAMPNLIALAADTSSRGARNTRIAVTYLGMPIGGALASFIVLVLPAASWRAVFLVGGAAPLLVAPLMALWMPRRVTPPEADAKQVTTILRTLFSDGRRSTTLVLWAGFLLLTLTLHLLLNWLPLLLLGRGMVKSQAALAQIGFNTGGALAAYGIGKLLDSRWLRYGIVATLLSLPLILALLAVSPPQAGLLFGLALLLGAAVLAQQVIAYAVASACYPILARGTGVGGAVAAGRIGSLVGPLFAASLLSSGGSPAQVLLGLFPLTVLCGGCVGLLGFRVLAPGSQRLAAAHTAS